MQGEEASGFQMPSLCPSFSSYSGKGLAVIAGRVSLEVSAATVDHRKLRQAVDGVDDEFEFGGIRTDQEAAESSGDGGLHFPLFDRHLLSLNSLAITNRHVPESAVPLGDLFRREQEDTRSSSSSEVDELEEIPSEIYCVWTPGRSPAEMSPSGCKKSKSTGSSSSSSWSRKRWRIRDLLKRSRSEGKQSLVILNPDSINIEEIEPQNRMNSRKEKSREETKKKKNGEKVSPHEKLYLRNKGGRGDKGRTYLPYKQDLVGLFANTGGLVELLPDLSSARE